MTIRYGVLLKPYIHQNNYIYWHISMSIIPMKVVLRSEEPNIWYWYILWPSFHCGISPKSIFQIIEEHHRCFGLGGYFMAAVLAAASYSRGGFSPWIAVHARLVRIPSGSTFHREPGTIIQFQKDAPNRSAKYRHTAHYPKSHHLEFHPKGNIKESAI